MRHRDPLTAARLAQIYDENPTPVVLELLWEIHRLRATISRCNQIRHMVKRAAAAHVPGAVWSCFENELDAEPCLSDPPTKRQQAQMDAVVENVARARVRSRPKR
jgi:hypothetical protein